MNLHMLCMFEDTLHEMSKQIFCEKEEKYFQMLSADFFIQHVCVNLINVKTLTTAVISPCHALLPIRLQK